VLEMEGEARVCEWSGTRLSFNAQALEDVAVMSSLEAGDVQGSRGAGHFLDVQEGVNVKIEVRVRGHRLQLPCEPHALGERQVVVVVVVVRHARPTPGSERLLWGSCW